MRVGVNLPQYAIDFADPGRAMTTVVELARLAEDGGIDDVWLSDHPFVIGPDGACSGALEPLVALAALSRRTKTIGLGTLVLASTMRAPALVGHMTRTMPASRMTIGAGSGWYRPEHRAFGIDLPPLAERMPLLEATLRAAGDAGARTLAGGVGDEVIDIAARSAAVWNAAWDPPAEAFQARSRALEDACERAGRKPGEIVRSVGVNVLVAENEAGIEASVGRLRRRAPFLEAITTISLRERTIVGTPAECAVRILAYDADEVVATLALRDDPVMLRLFATEVLPSLHSAQTRRTS